MKTFDQLLDEVIEEVWAEEYQTVLHTAMEVRLWTENLSKEEGNWKSYDVAGYCAIASGELYRRLTAAGIEKVQLAMWLNDNTNDAHVFLVWRNRIIDVTATQFIFDGRASWIQPVEIRHLEEAMRLLPEWTPVHYYDSPEQLRAAQINQRWPNDQVVKA